MLPPARRYPPAEALSRNFLRRWRYALLVQGLSLLCSLMLPLPAASLRPEILHYKVSAPLFPDAGRAVVTLRVLGNGRYEGEIKGETSGAVALFSGHRRDRYRTTMQAVNGKLQPLFYIEESWVGKKHRYKEYRFDYEQRRLEMWRQGDNGELVLTWETELIEPLYDPITAFYNFRTGRIGPLTEGESLEVKGIPYPQPETIVIHLGAQEPGKRQATITIRQRPFDNELGLVHVIFDDELVPLTAWTRVILFGKLSGRLVDRY